MPGDLTSICSIFRDELQSAMQKEKPRETVSLAANRCSAGEIIELPAVGCRPRSAGATDALVRAANEITAVSAISAGAIGFLARSLVQTSLPHRKQPGTQYQRTDGRLTVSITALSGSGLPYGSYPRLILIWITSEAVRTRSRELFMGRSLSRFMEQLGLQSTGGHWGTVPRFRDQLNRLLGSAITSRWSGEEHGNSYLKADNLLVADSFELWWTPRSERSALNYRSSIQLSQPFFEQITAGPVPLDLRAVRALKRSPLALDLYAWATRRVSYLNHPIDIPWFALRSSFGAGYAETPQGRSRFRANAIEALRRVSVVYPQLKWSADEAGLNLRPSLVHVPKLIG